MTTRKIHERVCERCGAKYVGGKYSKVCDKCRVEACGRYHGGSKRGRLEAAKKDNKERFEKMLDVFIERNKEPLPEHETCPNFNQDDLSCVLCGYDEWKFKKCGEKKK